MIGKSLMLILLIIISFPIGNKGILYFNNNIIQEKPKYYSSVIDYEELAKEGLRDKGGSLLDSIEKDLLQNYVLEGVPIYPSPNLERHKGWHKPTNKVIEPNTFILLFVGIMIIIALRSR